MYLLAAFITFNIVIIDRIPNTNLKKRKNWKKRR